MFCSRAPRPGSTALGDPSASRGKSASGYGVLVGPQAELAPSFDKQIQEFQRGI